MQIYISHKATGARIYKELSELNSKKTNDPVKKWAKDLNRYFAEEDIRTARKHMKGCLTSLVMNEMQINSTTHLLE